MLLSAQDQYKKFNDEGFTFLTQGKLIEAIEKYKQALSFNPNGLDANYGIGVCYSAICIQNGSYCMDALDHFLKVEQLAGAYRYTFRNMSTCYIKTYQYQKAIEYSSKAIRQDSKDGESYYYRGTAKIELKQTEEGCLDLQKSHALGFPEAKDKIDSYCNK